MSPVNGLFIVTAELLCLPFKTMTHVRGAPHLCTTHSSPMTSLCKVDTGFRSSRYQATAAFRVMSRLTRSCRRLFYFGDLTPSLSLRLTLAVSCGESPKTLPAGYGLLRRHLNSPYYGSLVSTSSLSQNRLPRAAETVMHSLCTGVPFRGACYSKWNMWARPYPLSAA